MTGEAGLSWQYFSTNLANLFRTPILISSRDECILVDGAFTLGSGRMLVDAINSSGKRLRSVIVTCSDPDYYFGLGPVRDAFPEADVVAPAEIAAAIASSAESKIKYWAASLGEDGPRSADALSLPVALQSNSLFLSGEEIRIQTAVQPNRYSLWLESSNAILGGVQIVSGIHVWMADTIDLEVREQWTASLEAMAALKPVDAVPGHLAPGASMGVEAILFTRDYIKAFNEELPRARDGAHLIAAMRERYPSLAMEWVLELGAKVCKGEARWPL